MATADFWAESPLFFGAARAAERPSAQTPARVKKIAGLSSFYFLVAGARARCRDRRIAPLSIALMSSISDPA
jgi:hypothetical protein